jgi:tetratricopeptide (TPR) repeat protein
MEHKNKGAKLFSESNYTDALGEFNTAESAMREYIRLQPTDLTGYDELRNIYNWIQATQEKLDNAKERSASLSASMCAAQIAAWLTPEDPKTKMEVIDKFLDAMHELSVFLYNNGRFDEALTMVQEEVVVAEGFLQEAKQSVTYLWRLGDAKGGLGKVRRALNTAGWEEAIRSGLIHIQSATQIDTKNPKYPLSEGYWRRLLAEELKADDRNAEAREEYRLTLEAYQEAAERAPGDEKVRETIWDLVE